VGRRGAPDDGTGARLLIHRKRTAGSRPGGGFRHDGGGMDDDLRIRLFDPQAAHSLVLARRPPSRSAVACVVSDVVWHEVVVLLRWAAAGTGGTPDLDAGRWWRLAAGCADLLRRLPALSDELAEPWQDVGPAEVPAGSGRERVERVADRLWRLLRSPGPLPLAVLATEVDALGAAAISALAETSPWTVPG
jgi:hypothetical protein